VSYQVGKRFTCEECGTQCLVTKPSEPGELSCCGKTMTQQEPKQLASSD
jgi:transcription elongation factor Elf1